ncbi:pepsinogen c [Xylariaceae sp. FL0804]|nr:pepsinogen c [Xylariaceae sp. FL0804]
MISAYHSFGAFALASLASAAVFELPITFRNSYAIVDVEAGSPAQRHTLMFDTGSSTTWMVDAECAEECENHSGWSRNGYNETASSTSSKLGTASEITYLGGVTGGPGVIDQFSLNGTSWQQTFMAANASSWEWTPADGFLGLAFSTIAEAGTQTMVETMMQSGLLDQPRFGLYYGREFNDTGGAPGAGVLTLGGSAEGTYAEADADLAWAPLERLYGEYEVWRSPLRTVTSRTGLGQGDNTTMTAMTTTPLYFSGAWGVFDTGAGSITVPPLEVDAIYRSIGMNWTAILNGDHVPLCSEFNSSWSVSFAFGSDDDDSAGADTTVTVRGDQLARPGFAYRDDACYPPFDGGDTNGFFLFGTPLLNQFYTVWDFGSDDVADYSPRVGFGQLREEYRPTLKSELA